MPRIWKNSAIGKPLPAKRLKFPDEYKSSIFCKFKKYKVKADEFT